MVTLKSLIRKIVLLLALLGCGNKMCGQSKTIVPLNLYTQDNGLASLNIRKIIQDKYGFIWLATQGGLSRFDGQHFTNYRPLEPDPRRNILNNDVADISFSADSSQLYAVTPYGGISILDINTGFVRKQCPLASLTDGTPLTVTKAIAAGDTLFIGTDEGYFLMYDCRKQKIVKQTFFQTYGKLAYIISNYVLFKNRISIFLSNGDVYQYTTDLRLLNKSSLGISIDLLQGIQVNTILPLSDSICALATDKGLLFYDMLRNRPATAPADYTVVTTSFRQADCKDVQLYKDNLWVVCSNQVWRCNIKIGTVTEYTAARDPEMQSWLREAKSLLQTDNTLYLTSGKGLAAITNINCPFTAYYKSSDGKFSIPLSYTLCSRPDSAVIVAASDGIYREQNHNLSKIYTGENVHFVAPFLADYLIASQAGKTFLLDRNFKEISLTSRFPELSPVAHDLVISSVNIGDSLLLFASDNANGVYFWYPKARKLHIVNSGSDGLFLKANTLNALYLTKDKEKVVILCDNQLSVYHIRTGAIAHASLVNPATSLPLNIILDICESGGYYWAAVYGTGIVQLDQQFRLVNIYGLKQGLPTSEIYKIIPVDRQLYVSSNKGIILFNTARKTTRLFTRDDGLQANEFEEYSGLSAHGRIYFGGVNGFTAINPSLVNENTIPPRFYLTHVNVQTKDKRGQIDSSNLLLDRMTIPNNWLQATLSFTGINHANPARLTYQYRIRENDTGWIDLGKQDFISLIGLGPGTYHLEARAANEDGYISLPRLLQIAVQPRWFETWWFYLSVVLLIAAIIYALYKWRIRQLKQQQDRLKELRQEIAGDLHDDIGSVLNAIKLFAHMAEHAPEKQQYFVNIKTSLKQASEGLRDMIWVLDDNNDAADELLNRIQYLLLPVVKACNVELVIVRNFSQPAILGKREKRNLLMITKEAVNNSLKYANCKKITIEFTASGQTRSLLIKDDGQGYAEQQIVPGNGLKNIQYRARQICYDVQVHTAPGQGVAYTLVAQHIRV
ncbi:sensor histidine kinase [Chitinophaga rhizophila]|uniref:histidine kinase n=1 Tax=Chitinophaga rhizophila TaxID=2866212 RepID=A0ABS7G9R0_9BACT|nr:triple tyrosine motif-containing protein [Chitinophaga rhizophila]MBW8683870.1 hypothetical protein [Chitinophaga rhizophila]